MDDPQGAKTSDYVLDDGDILINFINSMSQIGKPDVIRALYTMLEETTPKPLDPYRNAGKPWTEAEDDKLVAEFHAKEKVSDIAKEHGRTYGAIESRFDHLGLKKKPFWLFKRK